MDLQTALSISAALACLFWLIRHVAGVLSATRSAGCAHCPAGGGCTAGGGPPDGPPVVQIAPVSEGGRPATDIKT